MICLNLTHGVMTCFSHSMLVGSKRKLDATNVNFNVFYKDSLFTEVTCEKLLGVQIDNCLSFNQQINKVCSVISSRLGLLMRLKMYVLHQGLCMYYNGYILPLLDYCSTIWGETTINNIEKISKLQK